MCVETVYFSLSGIETTWMGPPKLDGVHLATITISYPAVTSNYRNTVTLSVTNLLLVV